MLQVEVLMSKDNLVCHSLVMVDGEFEECRGTLEESIHTEKGKDLLVERCTKCGRVHTLEAIGLKPNIRQRSLSDDLFRPTLQFLL